MLKYILTVAVALTMLACESDQQTTQTPGQDMPDQQSQNMPDQQSQGQFQPGQSASNIEVSDEELEKFTEVSMVAQEIQMGSQQEMMEIVEDEGLDVETYNLIAEARFNGQDESELDISSEDLEKFDAASEEIESSQAGVEAEMSEAIEAEGMEMERFMEINRAIQQDQELQQRIQQMMMQGMQQQGQPQGQQPQPQNQ